MTMRTSKHPRLTVPPSWLWLALLACLGVLSCKPPQAGQQASKPLSKNVTTTTEENIMPTYYYIDALSSVYTLQADSLVYDPIKPAQSSSGMADGGEPARLLLASSDAQRLRTAFEVAIGDKAAHIPDRIKGCGTITRELEGQGDSWFLDMNAASKGELESTLKALLAQ
jgi:hypothetical protein